MAQIPIYLINLDRSPDRLALMQKQLSNLGLSFERINAIDGHKLDSKSVIKYQQESKQSWLHYSTLTAGEIGCAMSWHKAWAIVTNEQEKAAIVLEDDVKLDKNFKNTIEKLSESLDKNIIIDLSNIKGKKIVEKKVINGITLIRYQTPPLRNFGAIYGKKAAQIFLKNMGHFKAPVDTLQTMTWQHNIPIYSLEKPCLSHHDIATGGSTITTTKKPLLNKIKKELMRPLWRGFIAIKNFF